MPAASAARARVKTWSQFGGSGSAKIVRLVASRGTEECTSLGNTAASLVRECVPPRAPCCARGGDNDWNFILLGWRSISQTKPNQTKPNQTKPNQEMLIVIRSFRGLSHIVLSVSNIEQSVDFYTE